MTETKLFFQCHFEKPHVEVSKSELIAYGNSKNCVIKYEDFGEKVEKNGLRGRQIHENDPQSKGNNQIQILLHEGEKRITPGTKTCTTGNLHNIKSGHKVFLWYMRPSYERLSMKFRVKYSVQIIKKV